MTTNLDRLAREVEALDCDLDKVSEPTTDEALRAAGYVLAKGDHDG